MARLSDEEIGDRSTVSEWRRDGDHVVRDFALGGFARTMDGLG